MRPLPRCGIIPARAVVPRLRCRRCRSRAALCSIAANRSAIATISLGKNAARWTPDYLLTAVDLAGEQQRVQRHAEVIDDDVVDDFRRARRGIDLDLGDVGAIRIGRLLGHELVVGRELVLRNVRTLREIGKGDDAVGAGDAHSAVGDLEVVHARLERVGGELFQVIAKRLCRFYERRAGAGDRAGTAGARALRGIVEELMLDVMYELPSDKASACRSFSSISRPSTKPSSIGAGS